jgi:hypothetical protein
MFNRFELQNQSYHHTAAEMCYILTSQWHQTHRGTNSARIDSRIPTQKYLYNILCIVVTLHVTQPLTLS